MQRVLANLEDLLRPERVLEAPPEVRDKWALVRWLGEQACAAAGIAKAGPVVDALLERERILSTGIGLGIAVPHVRHPSVPKETICVARTRGGMPFESLDRLPVFAAFCILMPAGEHRRYIEILGAMALALKDEARRARIFAAEDPKAFVDRILGRS